MQGAVRHREAHEADELLNPSYWLVFGLEWRGGSAMAEAAVAVAPGTIPRGALSHDAYQVLGCADLYAHRYGLQVIFFSDLSRMFTDAGTSWFELGVDWENALRELCDGTYPAMFLTVSESAYLSICNPETSLPGVAAADAHAAGDERELIRQVITRQLASDWSPYIHSLMGAGRVTHVG
jgi:hypothetical protein